ncbi:MAG: hypothetical protein GY827_11415 [Cytophagales bacterium]|nr:hypothetical protein [Cytophagales bacterium]
MSYHSEYKKLLTARLKNIKDEFNENSLQGRILTFQIGIPLNDNSPSEKTNGFFDEFDISPIDTWFYIKDEILFCWIPNDYEQLVNERINT